MKWVTRAGAKTDRVACPWLIKKFIDEEAEFLFVPREEVLAVAEREGAISLDASGARYTRRQGKCSFEVLVEEHGLTDPALLELAAIVHAGGTKGAEASRPEGAGLKAVAEGFNLTTPDDREKLRLEFPIHDALYAYCQQEVSDS